MVVLLAIITVLALAIAIAALLRARRKPPQPTSTAPQDPFSASNTTAGDPRQLKAGEVVEYLGERLFVRGSLRLSEGGFTWSEHFVDAMDGTDEGRRWISVEEDPDLEVIMWTAYKGPELQPSQRTITVDGITYQRTEHGTASYRSEGTTGLGENGRMEYADFDGPAGRSLAFERFLGAQGEGTWEASLGERVPTGTLTIYPGGGA
ncbi:DUF4178 domain-containing protein [Streptomyces gobiensis]|uniref:DUF4178 domain-containing protein n=1 Tax=Streptomyces gobiensis TaxID=2875706 RepID=UPI001E3A2422|nr:DUF4178 domain-containing protein [Streptomyces gobiensis]UGY93930.1 DUF4178 domain-containing protein [Streptomyces gobiensis]